MISYILGSGCSLRLLNKKLNGKVFCVNASILKYPYCDYFISDDSDIMNWSYFKYVQKSNCIKYLYKKKFMPYLHKINTNNINLFQHKQYIQNNKVQLNNLIINKQFPVIGAATSVASAVHIAYILGSQKIILLGVDNCFTQNKKYFFQFQNQPKCQRTDRLQNYHQNNDTSKLFNNYWKDFRKMNQNINIINGSGQYSALEVFPKENHLY